MGNQCFIDSKNCPDPDTGKSVCTPTNDPKTGCNTASCSPCELPNATAQCGATRCEIKECDPGFEDCDLDPATGCEVNLQFDPTNCGVCQNNCFTTKGPNFTCENGECAVTNCQPPTTADCDGDKTNGCEIDTLTDVDNCGFCTNKCDLNHAVAKCEAVAQGAAQFGECAIDTCKGAWADCDGAAANGCEINTGNNTDHCGGCGKKCDATNGAPGCFQGDCTIGCYPGFGNCNNNAADGCERNLNTDVNHCGTCGKKCSPQNVTAPKCSSGSCDYVACLPGFGDCDGDRANGCETNTNQDPNHCGTCGNKCNPASGGSPLCNTGTCGTSCTSPTSLCQPPGLCANLNNDVNHCGSCNHQCTTNENNAMLVCISTKCGFSCNSGYTKCGSPPNSCVDTDTSTVHCGGCNKLCTPPTNGVPNCSGGTCGFTCPNPYSRCGNTCKNLNTDTANCLTCGKACTQPPGGVAICTPSGCDFTCNTPLTKCGAACVNLTNDDLNCGTCGKQCGANKVCQSSNCVCSASYPTECGTPPSTFCVDTTSDNDHCSGCNMPCPSGQQCQSSKCECTGAGMTTCGPLCVDTTSDDEHCGDCTTDCTTTGRVCNNSACKCPGDPRFLFCDNMCRDTDTDDEHCGDCTISCNGSQNCVGGVCVPKSVDAGSD